MRVGVGHRCIGCSNDDDTLTRIDKTFLEIAGNLHETARRRSQDIIPSGDRTVGSVRSLLQSPIKGLGALAVTRDQNLLILLKGVLRKSGDRLPVIGVIGLRRQILTIVDF